MTGWNRTFAPIWASIIGGGFLFLTRGRIGFLGIGVVIMLAYTIWFCRQLSDVWLDGDELEVKGPASFRAPLADVLLLEATTRGRGAMVVLGLDHPVGKVTKVRFIPEGSWVVFGPNPADILVKDLQARIHAARAARTS